MSLFDKIIAGQVQVTNLDATEPILKLLLKVLKM